MWAPASNTSTPELLATTGDYLRLWSYNAEEQKVELKSLLNNNRHTGKSSIFSIRYGLISPRILCPIDFLGLE
jgi:hypothetical protein